jgi:RNA polymerase primary sigma factor
MRKANEKLNKE